MFDFERPLKVGKIDNYTLTLKAAYLDGEAISSANVTVTGSGLTIGAVTFNGSVISVLCTGVSVGSAKLHYSWAFPSTKSGCESHAVIIEAC